MLILQLISISIFISIFISISVDGLCTGPIGPINPLIPLTPPGPPISITPLAPPGPTIAYSGPTLPFEKMVNGFDVLELGLIIAAGPSTVPKSGMGMFICCDEYTDEVLVPSGTVVCGYSNSGVLKDKASGDKTVAYYFDSLDQGCVFQKRVLSLRKVLNDDADAELRVLGHSIDPDDENKFIFDTDPSITRHFVPAEFDLNDQKRFSPQEMGVLANDLGFSGIDTSEESYRRDNDQFNILELVWRLEQSKDDARLLVPTYPVIITMRDILFKNLEPMEVGLSYGWGYWQQTMLQEKDTKKGKGFKQQTRTKGKGFK